MKSQIFNCMIEIHKTKIELDKAIMYKSVYKEAMIDALIEDYINAFELMCFVKHKFSKKVSKQIAQLYRRDIVNIVEEKEYNFNSNSYPNIKKMYEIIKKL